MSITRTQAEHLLDAYLKITYHYNESGGNYAHQAMKSLREVILDAMTEYRTSTVSTYPDITLPYTHVTNPTYKPIVTCDTVNHNTCAERGE